MGTTHRQPIDELVAEYLSGVPGHPLFDDSSFGEVDEGERPPVLGKKPPAPSAAEHHPRSRADASPRRRSTSGHAKRRKARLQN
jgi:hypothetical protein